MLCVAISLHYSANLTGTKLNFLYYQLHVPQAFVSSLQKRKTSIKPVSISVFYFLLGQCVDLKPVHFVLVSINRDTNRYSLESTDGFPPGSSVGPRTLRLTVCFRLLLSVPPTGSRSLPGQVCVYLQTPPLLPISSCCHYCVLVPSLSTTFVTSKVAHIPPTQSHTEPFSSEPLLELRLATTAAQLSSSNAVPPLLEREAVWQRAWRLALESSVFRSPRNVTL